MKISMAIASLGVYFSIIYTAAMQIAVNPLFLLIRHLPALSVAGNNLEPKEKRLIQEDVGEGSFC